MLSKEQQARLIKALEMVAPGKELRTGLEHILSAQTGALIVMSNSEQVMEICNGGFFIDTDFASQRLFELAKMDGAIILSDAGRRILYANVHLVPNSQIQTNETGMRHRTAERVAKQTGTCVISISQNRRVVSLYIDDFKYVLESIPILIAKANQALQTLEKYKARLDQVSSNLSALEFEDLVTLADVVTVLQRSEMVERIAREVNLYISELGTEGRLIRMQLDELMGMIATDSLFTIRDYSSRRAKPETIKRALTELTPEELLDFLKIVRILGYEENVEVLERNVHARGYRLMNKIPRLPSHVIGNIINRFGDLQRILKASLDDLDDVDGVGEVRARVIQDGLRRLKEYNLLERYL